MKHRTPTEAAKELRERMTEALESWTGDTMEITTDMVIAMVHLDALTVEQRSALLGMYCHGCGTMQPWHPLLGGASGSSEQGCQCWNDD